MENHSQIQLMPALICSQRHKKTWMLRPQRRWRSHTIFTKLGRPKSEMIFMKLIRSA